jgi:hypothetical protein
LDGLDAFEFLVYVGLASVGATSAAAPGPSSRPTTASPPRPRAEGNRAGAWDAKAEAKAKAETKAEVRQERADHLLNARKTPAYRAKEFYI